MRLIANLITIIILLWLLAIFAKLLHFTPQYFDDIKNNIFDYYLIKNVIFSFWQSFLSLIASFLLAIILIIGANNGKLQILKYLLPVTNIFPSLLLIISAFDLTNKINQYLNINLELDGLFAIVILHSWLNGPLIAFLVLPIIKQIPNNYSKQQQILKINKIKYLTKIILPIIKPPLKQSLLLVFLLCFTSFTIPLVFSQNIGQTNLEVAIYQAVKYEFNLPLAAALSLMQIIILLPIVISFKTNLLAATKKTNHQINHNKINTLIEIFGIILLLIPIIILITNAIFYFSFNINDYLLNSIKNSIKLVVITTPIAVSLNLILINSKFINKLIDVFYLIPITVISLGSYLLFQPYLSLFNYPLLTNIFLLTIIIQPYLYKLLKPTLQQHQYRYQKLKNSLPINYYDKLIKIDLPALAPIIGKASGFTGLLILGDVAINSFFSNNDFITLASYLTQQLNNYQQNQAWQTGSYFLLLGLFIYLLFQGFFLLISKLIK